MRYCLITGAAGSVGKALVSYISTSYPHIHITAVDSNEWALSELQAEFPLVRCRLCDFVDIKEFEVLPGTILFHLAAYKHLPLGQTNPDSFIKNNVTKTAQLYDRLSRRLDRIVYVSTDKAVEPCSTYGYTKALAEDLTWWYSGVVVRMGNIISSSGSVIPLWEQAIKEGKPLPITSWDMERYMIEADTVAKFIFEASEKPDKVQIPAMGKPKKLKNVVSDILRRNGYTLETYKPGFEVIGVRDREKLSEKLKWEWE